MRISLFDAQVDVKGHHHHGLKFESKKTNTLKTIKVSYGANYVKIRIKIVENKNFISRQKIDVSAVRKFILEQKTSLY